MKTIGTDDHQQARASLDDVLITSELQQRSSRAPDYERQAQALDALATALADGPDEALQKLVETVVELCDAGSAGVSLIDDDGGPDNFHWGAVAGAWADKRGGKMPIDASPCGVVVARNTALLFAHPEQHFPAANVDPLISEILLVPLHAGGRPIGTIWAIAHAPSRRFDREDVRLLLSLSRLAGAMAQTTASLARTRDSEAGLRRLNTDLEHEVEVRSRERSLLWQHTLDLLCVIDLSSATFERVNPAWQTLLGWESHYMEGRAFAEFVHPDDVAASAASFESVRRGDPVLYFENRYRSRGGEWRRLSWAAVPEGGKLYCTTRDVTVERLQLEAFARTEDALRQSQKMEAVGQLTGGLAHDFNNLLAGISGAVELMQVRLRQRRYNDFERYLSLAQGACQRAASLTHRLLAFSRRQTLDPRPTKVDALVQGMCELIQRTVGPAISITVEMGARLWNVMVDPSQLENALLNLCINARDALPDGGRIVIEAVNVQVDDGLAGRLALVPGEYLALSVRDDGCGMPPEVMARVFEPFYTTKPIGEGTGLGLSMIYGFAQQSGGQVKIDSQVGHGTTICIYLPRHAADIARPLPDETDGKLSLQPQPGATVLVVDDEPTVRMLIADVLSDLGYTAIEANDSAAGLKMLQSDARIDLLITDVGLPGGMNGRQLADAARVTRRDLKIIFVTGYAESAVFANAPLAPGMTVLSKPFAMGSVGVAIQSLLKA